jgi:Domain of unknown function (DUF4381)
MADNATTASELFGSNRMWGLKEIPLPDPVAYFPETIGWLFLLLLFGLFLGILIWIQLQRWRQRAYLRQAIRDLREISRQQLNYAQIPLILRRTALQIYNRAEIASLHGQPFTDWLNGRLKQPVFDPVDGELIAALPYAPPSIVGADKATLNSLVEKCIFWLKKHHV